MAGHQQTSYEAVEALNTLLEAALVRGHAQRHAAAVSNRSMKQQQRRMKQNIRTKRMQEAAQSAADTAAADALHALDIAMVKASGFHFDLIAQHALRVNRKSYGECDGEDTTRADGRPRKCARKTVAVKNGEQFCPHHWAEHHHRLAVAVPALPDYLQLQTAIAELYEKSAFDLQAHRAALQRLHSAPQPQPGSAQAPAQAQIQAFPFVNAGPRVEDYTDDQHMSG